MSDPADELQIGVEASLRAWQPLAAAMELERARLYDIAPTNAPYPHGVFGEDQVLDDAVECIDGAEAYVTLHFWDQADPPNLKRVKRMAKAGRDALLANLVIAGHEVVLIEHDSTRAFLDADLQSGHAVVTMRLLLEPIT